jgi:hypothetical protein
MDMVTPSHQGYRPAGRFAVFMQQQHSAAEPMPTVNWPETAPGLLRMDDTDASGQLVAKN